MKNLLIVSILFSQITFSQSVSDNLDKSVKEIMSEPNALSANLRSMFPMKMEIWFMNTMGTKDFLQPARKRFSLLQRRWKR